jgi:small subunit ribosomal protein S2
MAKIQLAQLLEAGVHFGHAANKWNPKMVPYIYREKNGIHILDLIQTAQLLKDASQFCETMAKTNKKFLFVGTNPQISKLVEQEAKNSNSFFINHRWLGGILTNWKTVKSRIERLILLEQQQKDKIFEILPKKEAANLTKELERLEKYLGGIKTMEKIPDIIIVLDQLRELTAIKEARSLKIPIIGILDTNCDPELIDIPIPANDDSISSIKLILKELTKSIKNGASIIKKI